MRLNYFKTFLTIRLIDILLSYLMKTVCLKKLKIKKNIGEMIKEINEAQVLIFLNVNVLCSLFNVSFFLICVQYMKA